MSVKNITNFLIEKPSYLKWGNDRLAEKFGVAKKTVVKIKKDLAPVKANYLASF
jgi:hypothetical protein